MKFTKVRKLLIKLLPALGGSVLILFNSVSPVLANGSSDTFVDTSKINMASSSNFVTDGALKISPTIGGDGADGTGTISVNKNINVNTIADVVYPGITGNAPIAWWKMDETVNDSCSGGQDACDSSGNSLHGTATGTTIVAGKYGNARSFNGSSTYIDIANSALFDVTNLTIEAWVYSTNFNQSGHIFEKGSVNTQYSCFFNGANDFYFRTYNSAGTADDLSFTTSSYFTNSAWNHVACVFNGSIKSVYVNGNLAASKSWVQTLRTGQTAERIGAYGGASPSYYFNGTIDDVRIYNYARSQTQIANEDMNLAGVRSYADGINYRVGALGTNTISTYGVNGTKPAAWWKMDEPSGANVADSSDNSNTGTAAGTTIVAGQYGNARSFNGTTSDCVSAGTGSSLNITRPLTIEAWIKTTLPSGTSNRKIVAKRNDSNVQYDLNLVDPGSATNPNKLQFVYYSGSVVTTVSTGTITDTNWHHVAVTVNSSGDLTFYIDGSASGTATGVAPTSYPTITNYFGARQVTAGGCSYNFSGTIDDVRIFNYVRSSAQLTEDKNNTGGYANGIASGDDVLLINMRGDATNNGNAGNYEVLTVQSVSGTVITTTTNILNTYGVGGNSNLTGQKIMVQRVPNYTDVTVNNGVTLTANAWDGEMGGLVAFKASGTVKVYGAISVNALGYRGGVGSSSAGVGGPNGESYDGYNGSGGTYSGLCGTNGGGRGRGGTAVCAAGNRGGGGGSGGTKSDQGDNQSGGGGGGGYGGGGGGGGGGSYLSDRAGGTGGNGGNTDVKGGGGGGGADGGSAGAGGSAGNAGTTSIGTGGAAGTTNLSTGEGGGAGIGSGGGGGGGMYGIADLSDIFLGSGGGASGTGSGGGGLSGGTGGGIIFIQGNTINVSGSVTAAGSAGSVSAYPRGGGGNGSGGSILLRGSSVFIGSYLVSALSSSGGAQNYAGGGGGGGAGRIRVEYITSTSGISSPSASSTQIAAGSYYTSATIQSNNLLIGISETISSIDQIVYNLSATGTTATIQYSQDASTWKNAAGTPGGTDTLTTGADNTISLSTLVWAGANFYYKIAFTGNGTNTPVLNDITVKYSLGSSGTTCSPPLGGNFTITSSCSFANNVDGVDNGNLTIKNGATLTVNADQILARNSGKSITIETGGSIWINTTGQIAETNLWVQDSDGDGLYNPSVNNGTATGTTINGSGKYGNARSFDASSGFITIPDSPGLRLSSSGMTWEVWINPSDISTYRAIFYKGGNNILRIDSPAEGNKISCFVDLGAGVWEPRASSTSAPTTGVWTHVACSWDGSNLRLYVNGALQGTPVSRSGTPEALTDPFYIGYAGYYFVGSIDDARVYKYARSASQIQEDMNKTAPSGTGPLAWWKMNESSGQSVANYAFQVPASSTPATGYIRRSSAMANSGGTGSDGNVTFSSSTNLNTWNHSGRTCADGGDAVNYSATSLGPNSASLSSSVSSGCLVPYDKVLLINLAGTPYATTNVGNYEILTVQSISGSTVYFTSNKTKYYGDSANTDDNIGGATTNQRVMLQRVPQYGDVATSGTVAVTPSAWNGVKGGVLAFSAAGTVTVAANGSFNANALGFRGGVAVADTSGGQNGESYDGYNGSGGYPTGVAGTNGGGRGAGGTTVSPAGNRGGGGGRGGKSSGTGGTGGGGGGGYGGGGAGGGGGSKEQGFGGGGGGTGGTSGVRGGGGGGGGGNSPSSGGAGGNAGAAGTSAEGAGGAAGTSNPSTGEGGGGSGGAGYGSGGGGGGGFYGIADLSKIFLGSGGGGTTSGISNGGAGGGIVLIYASTISVSGSISASGGVGTDAYYATGGGAGNGSGGSILLKGSTITLGANLVTAPNTAGGGASYQAGGKGGGGVGRIAVGATTVTGTANPSYTAITAP